MLNGNLYVCKQKHILDTGMYVQTASLHYNWYYTLKHTVLAEQLPLLQWSNLCTKLRHEVRADLMTACGNLVGAFPVESVERCYWLLECMLSRVCYERKMGYSVRDSGKSSKKRKVGT